MEKVPSKTTTKPSNTSKAKVSDTFLQKWLKLTKFNTFLDGVDIIPFKVPLSKAWDGKLHDDQKFYFKEVYDYSLTQKKPITDVIDLTDTNKYYDPAKDGFFPEGVKHHKTNIPGKSIPKPDELKRILDLVEGLIKDGKVIGVHCTHGRNRTGFIICGFLIERMRWAPSKAISTFKAARGLDIEHQNYKDYLEKMKDMKADYKPKNFTNKNLRDKAGEKNLDKKALDVKTEN